jgi:hypothetical protein
MKYYGLSKMLLLLMGKRVSMNGGWSSLGGLTEPSTTAYVGKMKMTEYPTRHPHHRHQGKTLTFIIVQSTRQVGLN